MDQEWGLRQLLIVVIVELVHVVFTSGQTLLLTSKTETRLEDRIASFNIKLLLVTYYRSKIKFLASKLL